MTNYSGIVQLMTSDLRLVQGLKNLTKI